MSASPPNSPGSPARPNARREPKPFFTIGHSTRPVDAFVDLLKAAEVALVVDVRTVPRSRTNPQYNSDVLAPSLAAFDIAYTRIETLGGLRSRSREMPADVNAFWQNQSFHNYADYAMTEPFRAGLARLRALGHETRCAIMCAESLWWRCHRRIIADYLLADGERVFHILGPSHIDPAQMTSAARPGAEGILRYPRED